MSDLEAAWEEVHAANTMGWQVGRPYFHDVGRGRALRGRLRPRDGPLPPGAPGGPLAPIGRRPDRWYTVADHGRQHRALVAWTARDAWGRIRKRVVIFGESGSSLYPWTEFVETDDERYAAGISDPAHPRALLKHGAAIPERFHAATVERTDQLFEGVRQGPSLRLVVGSDEPLMMVRHGYWVAGLRNRL